MGSWDVACALTGTPIMCGDECVLVVFNREFVPAGHIEWSAEYDIEAVFKSKYADYGVIEPVGEATEEYLDDLLENRVSENDRYYVFISKLAWDWAVKKFPVGPSAHDRWLRTTQEELLELIEKDLETTTDPEERAKFEKAIAGTKLLLNHVGVEKYEHQWETASVLRAFRPGLTPLAGYWATGQWWKDTLPEIVDRRAMTRERLIEIIMERPYLGGAGDEEEETVSRERAVELLEAMEAAAVQRIDKMRMS